MLGLASSAAFLVVDAGDADALRAVVVETLEASPHLPVLFYMRFFLHSIPEDVQETLIGVISSCARPGDMLAAEFRTTEDASAKKVFGRHYRRFQDGPGFGVAIRERHGFDPVFEVEGTGLSPYGDEDPVLYRVVARRRG